MKKWRVTVKAKNGHCVYDFTDENELTAYLNAIARLVDFKVEYIDD